MGDDGVMTDNPTSTPHPNEPDDATHVFTPGQDSPSAGASPTRSASSASSQSSAPTWRSTTSASSTSSYGATPGWRSTPAAPSSAASAPSAPSSAGTPWGGQQQSSQPWNAQQSSQPAQPAQPSQPWNGQNWNQQPGQASQSSFAQQTPYSSAVPAAAPAPAHKDGLRAVFDFNFHDMAAPLVIKILYVLVFVVGVLWWLTAILVGAGIAQISSYSPYGSRSSSGSGVLLVVGILFGWIPGAILVLLTRLFCEVAMAILKTQRNSEEILDHLRTH